MKKSITDIFASRSPKLPVVIAHNTTDLSFVNEKHILLLSPAFYWYKRAELAFKDLKSAKKVARSIFFGWIPDGEYRYFVFPEDDSFGFIAFDSQKVLGQLEDQGLDLKYVDRIIFAQSSLDRTKNLNIDKNQSLRFIDDSFVVIPNSSDEFDYLDPEQLNYKISYKPTKYISGSMDSKVAIMLFATVLIFLIATTLDLIRKQNQIDRLETTMTELLNRSNLPATSLQLNSVHKRLDLIKSEQLQLRDNLSRVLSLPIAPAIVEEIKLTNTNIIIVVETKGIDNEAKVAQLFKKEFATANILSKNSKLAVEIRWKK